MPALHWHIRISGAYHIYLGNHRHTDGSDRSAYTPRLPMNGEARQFTGFAANTLPAVCNDE
ncbi:hypothetical protein A9P44_13985 [Paenibacillus polymyxa]|nr:hypothetical protein A9P44_13985 [Paenibacillus polymyxa]